MTDLEMVLAIAVVFLLWQNYRAYKRWAHMVVHSKALLDCIADGEVSIEQLRQWRTEAMEEIKNAQARG